mmetsp:Transcript_42473/g.102312  ORF Transcript_42473/g.102312 Transcript_42473/m.102312 type:complete len:237 (-) Transcript_42473:175-885(-)
MMKTDFSNNWPVSGSVMGCLMGANRTKQFPRVARKIIRSNRVRSSVATTPVIDENRMSRSGRGPSDSNKLASLDGPDGPEVSSDTASRGASVMKNRRAFSKTSCNSTFSLYSTVSFSLYELSSRSWDSYPSNSASSVSNSLPLDASPVEETTGVESRNVSTVPADSISRSNLSISPAKNRSFRSNSSHRLTYETYRRWNGVNSGFSCVFCQDKSINKPPSSRKFSVIDINAVRGVV